MAELRNLDEMYWIRLKNGDPAALGYLYESYVDKLFLSAMRLTDDRELAKDALQEVFIQVWAYRETLTPVNHSLGYLLRVLRNTLVKKMKKEKPTAHLIMAESVACPERNREDILICRDLDKEKQRRLSHAMSSLTSRQALILKLHFYDGLSYEQIAERLSMNYQSVNNLAFRTMLRLRHHIYAALVFVLTLALNCSGKNIGFF